MEVLWWCLSVALVLLILFFIFLYILYIYLTRRFGELEMLGIPHPRPKPLVGNLNMLLCEEPGLFKVDIELRQRFGDVWGFYEGRLPSIVVADVDIIKQILVTDFSNFVNRRRMVLRGIFKYGLFDAMDDHWKHLRRLSSPAFSSGKLKYMHHQIERCAEQLKESLQIKAKSGESLEVKEVCSAFTMDVIAAIGFGLRLDSQKDVNNPFNVNGKKFFDMTLNPMLLISFFMPDLVAPLDKLGVVACHKEASQFFEKILKQAIKDRRESQKPSDHTDFLQLMLDGEGLLDNVDEEVKQQLKEGDLSAQLDRTEKGMTEDEIMAQALLFLMAGYETTATTMAFAFYLLASHPDIQNKVLEEIHEVWSDSEELKYEDINKLKYLDMCIDETLRLYPPAIRVDRRSREEVTYKNVRIPRDYVVTIPIRALHYDPKVWPEPEKFDPERFSPEAKAERNPYYYMPFGVGPRSCVGIRLALLELKLALATALKHFQFKVSSKCQEPLQLENTCTMRVKGGIWLDVQTRL